MTKGQEVLVGLKIQRMLGEGTIRSVPPIKDQFVSNVFLVDKKDSGRHPVLKLENLNTFVPYHHFKMEGLHFLKYLLKEEGFMCKIYSKDVYFNVPLNPQSRHLIKFLWKGQPIQIPLFWVGFNT